MPEKQADTFTESHLPSFKLYEMLKRHPSDLVNVEYCKTFSTTKYGKNGQIKKLCKAYINYLVKKERIRSKPEFMEMNCNILTYWLYNELSRTYHMDKTNCFNALSDINDMWILGTKFVTDSKACSCKPYLKITSYHDNWDHAKKLFDYSMDFNYLRDMKNDFNEKCDKLCTYLNEIADIYKKYKDVCILKNEQMCPVWGIEYENYNPEDFLDIFKCRDDEEEPVTIEHVDSEEDVDEEAEKEVEEVMSVHDGSSDTPLNIMDYQQVYEIKKDDLKPLSTFGNTLLGLVLSSMLFGVLYKVNENYINVYKKYYPSKSALRRQFQNKFPNIDNMIKKLSKTGNRSSSHRLETHDPFGEYLEKNYIGYNPV